MPKEIYIDENGNERILSSSPSALSGLLDTDITLPTQSGQVLAYDSNGKVVNTNIFASGSFTAGTNVTILNGFYNKTGDMVFWSCCFSVSANVNTGSKILSGLPHKNEQDNLPCFMREIAASDTSMSCRIYRGDLYPNVTLTSGKTYHAMGVYTID